MGAVLALTEALKAASSHVRAAQSELAGDHIRALIHRQSIQADLAFYDSPEYRAAREARAGVSDFDMLLAEAY